MGRAGRKANAKQGEAKPSAATEPEPPPPDFSHLRPVAKNRALLLFSAVLLTLWFAALVALVFVSRS